MILTVWSVQVPLLLVDVQPFVAESIVAHLFADPELEAREIQDETAQVVATITDAVRSTLPEGPEEEEDPFGQHEL